MKFKIGDKVKYDSGEWMMYGRKKIDDSKKK